MTLVNPQRISRSENTVIRSVFYLFPLLVFLTGCSEQKAAISPEFKLTLLSGEDFHAQTAPVFLLNYWATWCKPCLEEMPELNEFSRSQNVPLLGVNFDVLTSSLSLKEQREQAAKLQVEFGVLSASSAQALELNWHLPRPKGLPTTYLLSSTGALLGALQGPQTEGSLKKAVIQARAVQTTAGNR